MTATQETIRAIQHLLGVPVDGDFKTKSMAALSALLRKDEDEKAAAKTQDLPPMSKEFRAFMPFLFQWEGESYENDPDDPGGATKYGIDQRSHPGIDIRALTKAQAVAIYWSEWLECHCDRMTHPFAEIYFNCAVNMGRGRAEQFCEEGHTTPDAFLTRQENYYRFLASQGPKRAKFLKGWLNRTAALRRRFNII